MKKIFLFAICFLVLIAAVTAADLRVNLVDYEPFPVTPGNYFTMNFKATNLGSTDLSDVVFKLVEGDPFSVDGDNEITYSTIESNEEVSFSYRIRVDSDARSGYEEIKLRYYFDSESGSEDYDIYVQAIGSTLVIGDIASTPETIKPGEIANVRVTLKNEADFTLKNVGIKLNLDAEELPFAPINSVTEQKIDSIYAKDTVQVNFKIITLADAETKVYKIPVILEYYDEFGKKYEKSDVISLIISSVPELDITIDENNLIIGNKGTLVIKFVNKGLSDIKFLSAKLDSTQDYSILSTSNIYVGNIDSDDYESIEFEIIAHKNQITAPLKITYKDANNNDYSRTINLKLKPYTVEEAKQLGLIKSNTIGYVVLVIIVLIVIYVIYRRVKKKRRR